MVCVNGEHAPSVLLLKNIMIAIGDALLLADSQHHKSYKRKDNLYVDERCVLA